MKQKFQIGVFGSAFNEKLLTTDMLEKSYRVGSEIARKGHILITGATTGIPEEAAKAAKEQGGISVGISPASTPWHHKNDFNKPSKNYDAIIFTGMGFSGRNVINIRTCDACIFIGGEMGTLNEFTIAYYESKIIGILEQSGYISDKIRDLLKNIKTDHGASIFFDSNPARLVNTMVRECENRYGRN